jgi:hypothetical protein
MKHSAEVIDSIYECALLPELWPGVLDRLSGLADARGGLLFAVNRRVTNWTCSEVSRENMTRFANSDLVVRSPRLSKILGLNHAGFVRDNDHYTPEEMAQDPIYRDLLWPSGMGFGAATAIRAPTGDVVILSLERERARGPIELDAVSALDALRPHIARSALLSARLQLERAPMGCQQPGVVQGCRRRCAVRESYSQPERCCGSAVLCNNADRGTTGNDRPRCADSRHGARPVRPVCCYPGADAGDDAAGPACGTRSILV